MSLYSPRSKPGARVAVYMRVSSLNQAKEGQGLDVQEASCMSVIEKNKWKLYKKYYNPEGVSGDVKATDRYEFRDLLADAKKRKFTIFLVHNLDRLGRKNRDISDTLDLLYAEKLRVYVGFHHIENNPLGRLLSGVQGEISQYDKVQILNRMNAGLNRATEERGEKQGRVPYGYKRVGKSKNLKIEINQGEAQVVLFIYEERRRGNTQQGIANLLNAQGIKAPRSDTWDHKKVQQLLVGYRKEIYCGGLRNGGNELDIRWPQILPDYFKDPEEVEEIEEKETSKEEPTTDVKLLPLPAAKISKLVPLSKDDNKLQIQQMVKTLIPSQEKEDVPKKKEKEGNEERKNSVLIPTSQGEPLRTLIRESKPDKDRNEFKEKKNAVLIKL